MDGREVECGDLNVTGFLAYAAMPACGCISVTHVHFAKRFVSYCCASFGVELHLCLHSCCGPVRLWRACLAPVLLSICGYSHHQLLCYALLVMMMAGASKVLAISLNSNCHFHLCMQWTPRSAIPKECPSTLQATFSWRILQAM